MKQHLRRLSLTLLFLTALLSAAMAQFDVTGTVKSNKGEPLTGVVVAIKNTNLGTTTDVDGKYSIHVPGTSAILVYSYLGYRSQEKGASAASTMDVVMETTTSDLEEVIWKPSSRWNPTW